MKVAHLASVVAMIGLYPGLAWAKDSAPCAPCSSVGSAEGGKVSLLDKLENKNAMIGLNAAVRYGGLWPADVSLGAHWYMRQYVAFGRRLGFGMDLYFLTPAYKAALYDYPVDGVDVTTVGRACFSPGPVDVCGSIGFSSVAMQINVGPPVYNTGVFAGIQPSVNLNVLPVLAVNLAMDIGYYFKRDAILVDNLPNQRFEASPFFAMMSVGLAYRSEGVK